ncbi:hypothetical protein WR25_12722 [Diploscapter pachys]|uniref:Aquaporin n=1 Tax=Diploscapter pachys TaxID=2018661 RepID=A0A2A2LLG6_9BILA|nr:hypothetical protein WR25_12722 [Diploscapter pachys]
MESMEVFYPLFSAIGYFGIVFVLAEISRKVIEKAVSKHSAFYKFAVELIATIQMCTCVYENAIIVRFYGIYAFFLVVAFLLTLGGIYNRGAFVSPLIPIEQFYYGLIGPGKFLFTILAQTIGGASAFYCARSIWYYTLQYSNVHYDSFIHPECTIAYKVAFPIVVAFEIGACFAMRILISFLAPKFSAIIPFVVSSFLTFALVFIGVPGLNPVVASSRMFGCSGLDPQWFIAVYWVMPVIGWLLGAEVERKLHKPTKKLSKKKTN